VPLTSGRVAPPMMTFVTHPDAGLVGLTPASTGQGIATRAIDAAVVLIGVGAVVASAAGGLSGAARGIIALGGVAVLAAMAWGGGRYGLTLGGLAMGVRLVDHRTGLPSGAVLPGFALVDVRRGENPAIGLRRPPSPFDVHERAADTIPASALPAASARPGFIPSSLALSPSGLSVSAADVQSHAEASLAFDDGTVAAVRGATLVGRYPEGRPGEHVDTFVVVNDLARTVSRTHLWVAWDGRALWVEDRGSTSGTAVRTPAGHEALRPGARRAVLAGQSVLVGDRSFIVVGPQGGMP
jgi:hypothetical protein